VQLYATTYKMLVAQETESADQTDTHYYNLLTLLAQHEAVVPRNMMTEFYVFATNYGIRAINQGRSAFAQQLFELYNTMTERTFLLDDDGRLSPWHYKNIVKLGVRLRDMRHVRLFIEQHKHILPVAFAENAVLYGKALIAFTQKDYAAVGDLLIHKTFQDDPFYGLDTRALLLKTYYIQRDNDAFDTLIESSKVYLHREQKVSEINKTQFSNFIKYTAKLFYSVPNKEKATSLRLTIQQDSKVADKTWLLEKMDELLHQ
jgi:hypothetical protein